jgi:hypothetical protein
MEREAILEILGAVRMADASAEPFDVQRIVADLEREAHVIETAFGEIDRARLALLPDPEDSMSPILTAAGRQYLSRKGEVDERSIYFVAGPIDDLHARDALLDAGSTMIDRFGEALARGRGVEHARGLVPEAFEATVDPLLSVRLFAAAIALMTRLGSGDPAGCVAEEVMAVELLEEARTVLEMRVDMGKLEEDEGRAASVALDGIFELFEDDDVLRMFEMREPADAAVAGGSEVDHQAGVADQRLQSWFKPFWGIPATGHLADRGQA